MQIDSIDIPVSREQQFYNVDVSISCSEVKHCFAGMIAEIGASMLG
jgi:hypothetical protein